MNKQELINRLKEILTTPSEIEGYDFDYGYDFGIERAIALAEQLDEPEKPVVPKYVADWIEWCKKNNITFLGACTAICDNKNIRSLDASGWATKNQETFAKAWFYDYEVDKEKLYTVEIPRRGNPDHSVLRKYVNGKVCIDRHLYLFDNWRDYKCFQLTEAEIKKEYGWTWKYAEEVKE